MQLNCKLESKVKIKKILCFFVKLSGLTYLACQNIRFFSLFAAARNVPSGEEQGETDIFAGYKIPVKISAKLCVNFQRDMKYCHDRRRLMTGKSANEAVKAAKLPRE